MSNIVMRLNQLGNDVETVKQQAQTHAASMSGLSNDVLSLKSEIASLRTSLKQIEGLKAEIAELRSLLDAQVGELLDAELGTSTTTSESTPVSFSDVENETFHIGDQKVIAAAPGNKERAEEAGYIVMGMIERPGETTLLRLKRQSLRK